MQAIKRALAAWKSGATPLHRPKESAVPNAPFALEILNKKRRGHKMCFYVSHGDSFNPTFFETRAPALAAFLDKKDSMVAGLEDADSFLEWGEVELAGKDSLVYLLIDCWPDDVIE